MNTAVKDVMTTRVIWMEQDTPFATVSAAFMQHRVSALPVLNKAGEVIGVVSEADLLTKLALGGGDDHMPGMIGGMLHHQQLEKARATTAGDLMTTPPVTVAPQDTVEDAARLMYLRRVKHLPVVDADNHLAAADEQAAFDLLLQVAAAAHGLALFLRQGLFGVRGDVLDETADRAARSPRTLVVRRAHRGCAR
jgi:CBS domain-containing protein